MNLRSVKNKQIIIFIFISSAPTVQAPGDSTHIIRIFFFFFFYSLQAHLCCRSHSRKYLHPRVNYQLAELQVSLILDMNIGVYTPPPPAPPTLQSGKRTRRRERERMLHQTPQFSSRVNVDTQQHVQIYKQCMQKMQAQGMMGGVGGEERGEKNSG